MLGFSLDLTSVPVHRKRTIGAIKRYIFSSGTLPSGVSFQRASVARYTDASGIIQSAAVDTPRFDHDASGGALGLLIEGAATNFLLHNNDFSQSEWVSSNFSDTGTTTTAPNGTSIPIYSLGDGYIIQNLSGPTAGGTYTSSVWIKANQSGVVGLRNLGKDSSWNVDINLTTDWVRYEVTLENFNGVTPKVVLDNRAGSGFGLSGLQLSVWGWQVEEGASATSPIATASSVGTRSTDVARITDIANGTYDVRVVADGSATVLLSETVSGDYWPTAAMGHVERIEFYAEGGLA